MRTPARPVVLLALVALLMTSLAPVAALATSSPDPSQVAAESSALARLNTERAKRGLIALRVDPRLAALAQERADYMAANDLLSHTHAGGQAVWDMMSAEGITWYGAGEIIAYNTMSNLGSSAAMAVDSWMHSPPHKAIAMSTSYDYAAFGVAISTVTGRRYWAGVYLKGPDRTGAWAAFTSVTRHVVDRTHTTVTFRWTGGDVRLQVMTSGFSHFEIGVRVDGGAWIAYGSTSKTSAGRTWSRGHLYQFRVRGCDKAGNCGSWRYFSVTI